MNAPVQRGTWRPRVPVSGADRHGLGVLDDDTCLRLLSQERIGRLGLSDGGLPVILPVNFVLMDRTIVFRSEEGVKTRAAANESVACMEVDRFDRMEHSGWSVLATGRLALVEPGADDRFDRLPIVPWAVAGPSWFVVMSVELLSGRSIRHDAAGRTGAADRTEEEPADG